MYKVHSRLAQLALHKGDELPKTLIKPDSMKNEPYLKIFRKMVRNEWKIKPKT